MDGVFNCELSAIVNGFRSNSVASSSSFAPSTTTSITNTPTISINNNQMLDDIDYWDVRAMGNDFHSTFDAFMPSFATASTITTTPSMPINNSHDTIDLGLHEEVTNSFYPHILTSQTSFGDVATTNIPTITNPATIPINNVQTLHGIDDQRGLDTMANTFGSSPPFFAATTPMTTITTPAIPVDVYHQQNSNFQRERLNLNQPMNEQNIRRLLQNSYNYPMINLSKPHLARAPVSCKNWPLFAIPCFGKLPEPSTQQQVQHQGTNNCSVSMISKCTKMFGQSSSKSDKRIKERRVYKMPWQGHNSDPWSWRQYRQKLIYASKRIYYRCSTRNDCKAIRRVEQNGESVILKYTDHHNHPPPMNTTTTTSSELAVVGTNYKKNNRIIKEDCIFEGLGNLIDL